MEITVKCLDHDKYARVVDYVANSRLDIENYSIIDTDGIINRGNVLTIKGVGSVSGCPPEYQDVVIGVDESVKLLARKEDKRKTESKIREGLSLKIQGLISLLLE